MEDKPAKKKKPKISLTSQIKKLRTEASKNRDSINTAWDEVYKLRKKLRMIETIFPKKYFKISYSIDSNSKIKVNSEEIIFDFTLELAIISLKSDKTFPDTFKLIDVKILG